MKTLAVFLGPYRNLTTLTAAVLSLHPEVQVLNHAVDRLWAKDTDTNFIDNPDDDTLQRFMAAAVEASAEGQRGTLGGHILHSHAFDDPHMRELYIRRYGDVRVKEGFQALVWKESMKVQRRFMRSPGAFNRVCEQLPNVKFVLPLRRPLDCALSNIRTKHAHTMDLPPDASIGQAVSRVLDAFAWGLQRRDKRPERVFAFTQAQDPQQIFTDLAAFLGISAEDRWLADVKEGFVVRPSRPAPPKVVEMANRAIDAKLERWPEIGKALHSA